jgi:tetratricopeptide (TPR) repeat protein
VLIFGEQAGALWPLFGATNQLLAGLSLTVVTVWMYRQHLPWQYTGVPAGIVLVLSGLAMAIEVSHFLDADNLLLAALGTVVLALNTWIVLEAQGKLDEAVAAFRNTLKSSPDNITALTALGHAQALAGKKNEAERVIARLQELSKKQYVSSYQTAVIYAGLDNRKLALDWLEKSRGERFNWLPFLQVDPVFRNLRSEPRFIEMAQSLGLVTNKNASDKNE